VKSRTFAPLAIALAAVLCSAAHAQSNAEMYGLLDMGAGQFQSAGADKTWRADSGNMTTSYIGLRASEDLGGGLKARVQIEHFLRLDTGLPGRFNGDAFWARNAYVGFEGAFGTTTLGRNTTPLFVSTLVFNPLGDSFAFSPAIRHHFAGGVGVVLGDTGWNNSIRYASPNLNGFTVTALANFSEVSGTGMNLGANVMYFGGPLAATAAWQSVKNGTSGAPAGFTKQTATQLGASYNLQVAKLFGQYAQVRTDATVGARTTLYDLGVSVPAGETGFALVAYGNAKTDSGGTSFTRKTFSAGYDYYLSKRTDLYAVLMSDKASGLSSGTTFGVGVRSRF
jgi:predicted porin